MHYVMSDIHGQGSKYFEMLKKIKFNDKDTLYILGDVIDRGPNSIEILQDIMPRNNVELIMGNHEHMMIEYIDNQNKNCAWFMMANGGKETYNQFIKLSEDKQKEIYDYISNAYLIKTITVNDKIFQLAHACGSSNPDINLKYDNWNEAGPIVWGYNALYSINKLPYLTFDKPIIIINGHVMVQTFQREAKIIITELDNNAKFIDIDCGMAQGTDSQGNYYGKLACLRLEDMKQIYV